MLIVTVFGPEYVAHASLCVRLPLMLSRNHGSHFEKAKTAFEEGGGRDELVEVPEVLAEKREQESIEENENEKV